MAEYLLRARWQKPDAREASAGVQALSGWPADDEALRVMQERGIDMNAHRARQLTPELVQQADLTLVMETFHRDWIHQRMPTARGRVHLISQWTDLPEVPDPYRRGPEAFQRSAAQLEHCVASWVQRLS